MVLNHNQFNLQDKDVIKKLEKTRAEKKVDLAKALNGLRDADWYDWCRVRFGHLMSFHVVCDRQEKEQRDNEERARRRKVIEVRVELCRLKIVDPTWFSILTYAYLGKEKDGKRRCKAPRRREGHGTRSTAAMTSLPLDAHSAWELIFHHRFAVPPQMSLTLADFDQFFGFRRWNHTLPSKTWIRPQTWVKASKMHISVGLDALDAHSKMQVHQVRQIYYKHLEMCQCHPASFLQLIDEVCQRQGLLRSAGRLRMTSCSR